MKSQYSEFNFGLGETLDMLRDQVNGFAAGEIAPRAEDIDRDNLLIIIRGKREQVILGKACVKEIFAAWDRRRFTMEIDPDFAPALIGKGGATIRSLQDETGKLLLP